MEIQNKAHIAFFLPTLNVGGIEKVFITYANELVKLFYQVDFVLCKKEGDLLPLLSTEVNVIDLGNVRLRKSLFALKHYMKSRIPNIIITGGDFPNMMAVIASLGMRDVVKVVISQHNYYNIELEKLGLWVRPRKFLMCLLYPLSYKVIAVSKGIYEYLLNEFPLKKENVELIHNPIKLEEIKEASRNSLDIKLPDDYIVFIGRLSPVKNIPLLLNAFDRANLDNISLVIVGDGPEMFPLQEMVSKLTKSKMISFIGSVTNPLPILAKARCLVLPSFSEAFPTILLEALALNKAIVATPTKGALEILKYTEGTFISDDCCDIDAFANLIERASSQMIKCTLNNLVVNYDVTSVVSKLEKVIL